MNFTYFLPGGVVVLHIVIGGHYFTFFFVNDQRNLQTEKRQFKISRVGKNPSRTCKWFFFFGGEGGSDNFYRRVRQVWSREQLISTTGISGPV